MEINTKIESRPPIPAFGLFLLILALGLLPFAIGLLFSAKDPKPGIGLMALSLIPMGMGLGLLWAKQPRVVLEFTETGLVGQKPRVEIPYEKWLGISKSPSDSKGRFWMEIHHTLGKITLPPSLNLDCERVFEFLRSKVPPKPVSQLPSALVKYLQGSAEVFPIEKIHVYWELGPSPKPPSKILAFGLGGLLGLLSTGGVMGLVGPEKDRQAILVGFGMICFFVMLVVAVYRFRHGFSWGTKKNQSALAITPKGIALQQGKLKGKLTWKEITKIKYPNQPRFVLVSNHPELGGILVEVEGGRIPIHNIYNAPIEEIHETILGYWDTTLDEEEGDDQDSQD